MYQYFIGPLSLDFDILVMEVSYLQCSLPFILDQEITNYKYRHLTGLLVDTIYCSNSENELFIDHLGLVFSKNGYALWSKNYLYLKRQRERQPIFIKSHCRVACLLSYFSSLGG